MIEFKGERAGVTYGKLYKKTGKPFTFALTDHDGNSGVKEALKYIESDKLKFKHVFEGNRTPNHVVRHPITLPSQPNHGIVLLCNYYDIYHLTNKI